MLGLAYLYRCLSSVTSTLLPFRSPSISQNSIVDQLRREELSDGLEVGVGEDAAHPLGTFSALFENENVCDAADATR